MTQNYQDVMEFKEMTDQYFIDETDRIHQERTMVEKERKNYGIHDLKEAIFCLAITSIITIILAISGIGHGVILLFQVICAMTAIISGIIGLVILGIVPENIFFNDQENEERKLEDLFVRKETSSLLKSLNILYIAEKDGRIILKYADEHDVIQTLILPIWERKEKINLITNLFDLNTNTLYTKFNIDTREEQNFICKKNNENSEGI